MDSGPFTKACELGSIATVLRSIENLGQYIERFNEAQIDTELATRMTMQDLRVLLPDAPLGHCLRIHSTLSGLPLYEQDIPSCAIWRSPALVLSSGCMDKNTRQNLTIMLEFTLVGSSLMLSLAVAALMSPTGECADGTKCKMLHDADYMLWAVATAFFLFAVQSSWLINFGATMKTDSQLPHWMAKHWAIITCPHASFILGLCVIAVALSTRAWIMMVSEMLPVAVTAIMGAQCLCVWGVWFYIAMTAGELQASQLFWNQLGAFGFAGCIDRKNAPSTRCTNRVEPAAKMHSDSGFHAVR
jgi:hypothetical protein